MKKNKIIILMIINTILILSSCSSKEENSSEQQVNNNIVENNKKNIDKPHFNENGIWYEIFVRSFADGNDDGIGDFIGLKQKLDYLNDGDESTDSDLGINGIWLMPINASPSYHGYDVTDYYLINEEYGTMEEFETFLSEAHKRGIKVIMDLVVNHTSSKHPWFIESKKDINSSYRNYYHWVSKDEEGYNTNRQIWGHRAWNKIGDNYYYAIFWDGMPDLNYENQKVRDEIINVAKFWLNKGIDGFRMDAAMHIYGLGEVKKGINTSKKNIEWWIEFDKACREINPNYYLVGEVWDSVYKRAKYAVAFDTTFNFDVSENNIIKMVLDGTDLNKKNNNFINKLDNIYSKTKNVSSTYIDAPFLTNHDQRRSMNYFKGDIESMKLATNIYMTLPGNPFIYYGEEIGMLGNKPDERIREPFIWGDTDELQTNWEQIKENKNTISVKKQQNIDNSLLNHYKEIIRFRQNNECILKGEFQGIETSSSEIIAYRRYTDSNSVIVVHNLSKKNIEVAISELNKDNEIKIIYSSNLVEYNGEDEIVIPKKTTVVVN
ncbi:MAG: alpha-amylase family glycosyl hydrolase [Vallitalea sp.]|jgi:glycosidase|nr:alpha-amylase family glycosyl hydrolase [Vallitalea sp.]